MIYTAWHSLPPERIPTNMPLSSSLFDYVFPDALVLDVGCGHGRLAPCMTEKGAVYYGIDINKAAIQQANTLLLPHASFSAQDAECTDFSDGFFDMIIAQYRKEKMVLSLAIKHIIFPKMNFLTYSRNSVQCSMMKHFHL